MNTWHNESTHYEKNERERRAHKHEITKFVIFVLFCDFFLSFCFHICVHLSCSSSRDVYKYPQIIVYAVTLTSTHAHKQTQKIQIKTKTGSKWKKSTTHTKLWRPQNYKCHEFQSARASISLMLFKEKRTASKT